LRRMVHRLELLHAAGCPGPWGAWHF
jgi:hypothetical protein